MTLSPELLELSKTGMLVRLFKKGHISWRLLRDVDIFLTCAAHYTTDSGDEKGKKTRAVQTTAVQFNCSDSNVWDIIKKLHV